MTLTFGTLALEAAIGFLLLILIIAYIPFGALWSGICYGLGLRTAEEDYQAGRRYAEQRLAGGRTLATLERLWAESKVAREFGGPDHFDRGIRDVMEENGLVDPEYY